MISGSESEFDLNDMPNSPDMASGAAAGDFFNISPELLAVVSFNGRFLQVNPAWQAVLGFAPAEMANRPLLDFLHPDDQARGRDMLQRLQSGSQVIGHIDRYRCKDRNYRCLEWFCHTDGAKIFAAARDVTDRIQAETAMDSSRELLRLTLLSVGDGVIVTDPEGRISLFNRTAERLTGWSVAEATGRPLESVFSIIDPHVAARPGMIAEPAGTADLAARSPVVNANGEIAVRGGLAVEVEYSLSQIIDDSGRFNGTILVFRDITQRNEQLSQIKYLSYHDPLTGLYNRRFLEEEMRRLGTGRNLPVSIIMGDVNRLKLVNDAFGHEKGDELICKAAQAIQKGCRVEDLVSRWGGDEFLIYLPKTDQEAAALIIERIAEMCASESVHSIPVSIAFGSATQTSAGESIGDIIRHAEDRMYNCKALNGERARDDIVNSIIATLYARIPGEERHAKRVSLLCRKMAQVLSLDEEESRLLMTAGLMHDIGKVAVSDEILDKPGELTDEEWDKIRQHTEVGCRIVSSAHEMIGVGSTILAHHERWDGKGYPRGIKWHEIPFAARIVALADSYVAMTSSQPYRDRMTRDQAIAEIRRNAGTQFDPELAETFIEKVVSITPGWFAEDAPAWIPEEAIETIPPDVPVRNPEPRRGLTGLMRTAAEA